MLELVENLQRLDLSADQLAAMTTIYAGYCKQAGFVQPARAKQAQTQSKGPRPDANGSSLPTTTEKVSADLGISDDATANRVKQSIKSAKAAGVTVPGGTIETTSGEGLVKAGEAAKQEAEQKRKAKEDNRKAKIAKSKTARGTKSKSSKTETDGPAKQVLVRYCKNVARSCKDACAPLDGGEMAELVKWQAKLDAFHRQQIRKALDEVEASLRKFHGQFNLEDADA
jgi:hypothetical protein